MTVAADILMPLIVGLAPVVCFLAVLRSLDSYKLVTLHTVLAVVGFGCIAAALSYVVNGALLEVLDIDIARFSRWVAPVSEEWLKGLVIVLLVRANRIGFLVDAAILGFAVGTGFALVENLYFMYLLADAGVGTWVVRGFGTAVMHGGATATLAIVGLALMERRQAWLAMLPGLLPAIAVHATFNHLTAWPRVATLSVLLLVPLMMAVAFKRSERELSDWLGSGFDDDTERLELINSGHLSESPLGRYLDSLKRRFRGPVVADLLCYLRLHTELALRAKGLLLMHQNGFNVPVDEATRAKFEELRYLRRSIGRTGLMALQPVCRLSHKELWQLHMLDVQA